MKKYLKFNFGKATTRSGELAFDSLKQATQALKDKKKYDYFILLNDDVFLFNKALDDMSKMIYEKNKSIKSKEFIISFDIFFIN